MLLKTLSSHYVSFSKGVENITMESCYNKDLGNMRITLLYQVSHIKVKNIHIKTAKNIKRWDQYITLL